MARLFVAQRRFPVEPLERIVECRVPPGPKQPTGNTTSAMTMALTAAGFDRTLLSKWKKRQGIPEDSADRLACALGCHPAELWPEWWDGIDLDAEEDE